MGCHQPARIGSVLGVLVCLLTGCAADPPPDNAVAELPATDYRAVYRAAGDVLRRYGFALDRQDYRFGVLTTRPLDAPSVFEPWRRTNTTAGQITEATLNNERRTVTVLFEPALFAAPGGDPAAYLLRVEVLVERQQTPTRRLNGGTTGEVFAPLSAVPGELARRGIPAQYWTPVGRDPYLERRLLQDILQPPRG